jgi:hypothetical protein
MVWPVNRHQGEGCDGSFKGRFLISALDKTANRRLVSETCMGALGQVALGSFGNYAGKRMENQMNKGDEILRRFAIIR